MGGISLWMTQTVSGLFMTYTNSMTLLRHPSFLGGLRMLDFDVQHYAKDRRYLVGRGGRLTKAAIVSSTRDTRFAGNWSKVNHLVSAISMPSATGSCRACSVA